MNINSLILSPNFQIYVTHGYDTQMRYVYLYKLQNVCSGAQQELLIAVKKKQKRVPMYLYAR